MPEENDSSGQHTITLDSDLGELERLRAFIEGFCDREAIPDPTRYHLSVALEELIVNAIKHGACQSREGAIRLAMRMENGEVRMELSDSGIAFDPLQAPPPDLTQKLLTRPVGGLGIHLVRCLIPAIRYERRGGRNYLYLSKPVERDSAPVRQEGDREGAIDANRDGDHSG